MSKNVEKINYDEAEIAESTISGDLSLNKNSEKIQSERNKSGYALDKKTIKEIEKNNKKNLVKKRKARAKERRKRIRELYAKKKKEEKEDIRRKEQLFHEQEKVGKLKGWFRLDNAASIYPSAVRKNWNFVFRISATLKEKVDPVKLQYALDDVMERFPSFNVKLCNGFFWHYFEPNFNRLLIKKEMDFPCMPFDLKDPNGFLLRVLYSDYKIILEIFHGIADGRGALFFFNSLMARYLEKKGVEISEYIGCASSLDLPTSEEMEDSFFKNYTKEKMGRPKEKSAYKIKGNKMPEGMVNSLEGHISVSKLKEVANKYDSSISIFLASVIGYCIYKKCKNNKRPTRISVPVDLRSRFNSKTLRNFSSYINVEVSGEDLTFEDVLNIFKKELKNIDNKFLQANINSNVAIQKNFLVKILPLFLKDIILKNSFNFLGENYQTLAFSNIGRVNVPKEFDNFIDFYSVNLGRSMHNEKSIGVISYKDTLNICISSKIYEAETEKDIFSFLANLGLDVTIYSNRRDLYGSK